MIMNFKYADLRNVREKVECQRESLV